jgi:hypothetical protein
MFAPLIIDPPLPRNFGGGSFGDKAVGVKRFRLQGQGLLDGGVS